LVCSHISFEHLFFTVAPQSSVSDEEEEAAYCHGQAEDLRHRLNDLEDRHDEFTRAVEVAAGILGRSLLLLSDHSTRFMVVCTKRYGSGASCKVACASDSGHPGRLLDK
jgi:hypothetical protein